MQGLVGTVAIIPVFSLLCIISSCSGILIVPRPFAINRHAFTGHRFDRAGLAVEIFHSAPIQTTKHCIATIMTHSSEDDFSIGRKTPEKQELKTIRILALHGSEGTADSITRTLLHWNDDAAFQRQRLELQVKAIQAPFAKGSGYAWWTMPPNVRSYNASAYEGFETSAKLVTEVLQQEPFDIILGHSQGAILLTALLALGRIDEHNLNKKSSILLNGVAWPNPYTVQLEKLKSPLKEVGRRQVLFLVGANDIINPPDQAIRVQESLRAVCDVCVINHFGGHSVPVPTTRADPAETLQKAAEWVKRVAAAPEVDHKHNSATWFH